MQTQKTDRIPEEFRYFENIEKPSVQRQRKLFRTIFRFDPALPDDTVRTWAATYYDADPVAEDFVDEVYLKQGQTAGRAMVDLALEKGVDAVPDAPASLKRLFAELEEEPEWLDWEQVELGAKAFRHYGPHMYSFAGAATLEAYQENSVAKPLAFTGAYTGESANRRFLETAAFWIDVGAPGALRPGGKGVETAMRVRVMHVFVRKKLLKHPEWKLDEWGVPISQGDAILTLMGGSVAPALALQAIGYRPRRREIEAMLHFWRYVGHIMGIQPRWYPETVEDGVRLLFSSFVKSCHLSGEDGPNLAQSYVASYGPAREDSFWERMWKRLDYRMELGYTALFLPPWTYAKYRLPEPFLWRLFPFVWFPFLFTASTIRRHSSAVDDLMDRFGRWRAERWLARRLGERSAEYKAVEEFTR